MAKDWRDEAAYPLDLSPIEWAWEFVRRNREYRAEWKRALDIYLPLRPKYEALRERGLRGEAPFPPAYYHSPDPEHPDFWISLPPELAAITGPSLIPFSSTVGHPTLRVRFLLNPAQDHPTGLSLAAEFFIPEEPHLILYGFLSPSPKELERWEQEQEKKRKRTKPAPPSGKLAALNKVFTPEVRRELNERRIADMLPPPAPPPGTFYLLLTWDRPLDEQLEHAKHYFRSVQPRVFRRRRLQKKPVLWRDYLRVLDARDKRVSVKEIAERMFPHWGEKEVRDFLDRARKMTTPEGYRPLLALQRTDQARRKSSRL